MNIQETTLNWSQIEHVFFDMDGTILDLHFDNYFWLESIPLAYAKKNKIDNVQQVKRDLYQRIMDKKGTLEWYCLDYWERDLGLDIMAIKESLKAKIKPLPHAIDFLDFVKNQNCEMWLTTNSHRKGVDLKFRETQIEPYFHRVVSSHDYAHAKESQHFWAALQDHYHFDPQRVLFIDDSPAVLHAAKEYGIGQSLLMLKPDSTRLANPADSHFQCIESFKQIMPSLG